MLLRNQAPLLSGPPPAAADGYEHLSASSLALIGWLSACGIDYVLVGAVARALRGDITADGPVAIVPAPYGRNLDRLARALGAVHARERSHHELVNLSPSGREAAVKFRPEMLVRPERWTLRCGEHALDIEGRPAGSASYQELLYEAVKLMVAPGLRVEVAAPEDVEQYDQLRRTGSLPAMVVTRL